MFAAFLGAKTGSYLPDRTFSLLFFQGQSDFFKKVCAKMSYMQREQYKIILILQFNKCSVGLHEKCQILVFRTLFCMHVVALYNEFQSS